MAAQRRKTQALKSSSNVVDQKKIEEVKDAEKAAEKSQLALDHLPPLPLVFAVMACSGLLWVFALRDFLATGRNIAGTWDEAMLVSSGVVFGLNMNARVHSLLILTVSPVVSLLSR
jgi:hypothetical protein